MPLGNTLCDGIVDIRAILHILPDSVCSFGVLIVATDFRGVQEVVRSESAFVRDVLHEVEKVIVGQKQMVERVLLGMLTGGHVLLEGVPGLAKTLTVNTIAATMSAQFQRIQFTPDLLPADLLGTLIYNPRTGEFTPKKGPIFANIILADEINRAPAKVQSALLEAMQERQVTVGRVRHPLSDPFFVLATQNPIEQEGTYPLPEAQQDRFMFKVFVDYPNFNDEFEVARRTTTTLSDNVQPILSGEQIIELQQTVREVPVTDHVIRYALSLVRQTRVGNPGVPEFVQEMVGWGAGPRAVQFLILGGKARALIYGRSHVSTEDIQAIAKPVLRHRIVVNFAAESDGVTSDQIIERLIDCTPTKEDELTSDARFQKIFAS